MKDFQITNSISLGYIIPCLLIATGYAYFLYKKKYNWTKKVNSILFSIRFTFTFLICLLFLDFLITQFKENVEPAKFVILVDNSSSVSKTTDPEKLKKISPFIKNLKSSLKNSNVETHVKNLYLNPIKTDSLVFNQKETNISNALKKVNAIYENQNLSGILLISDGIYNKGASPLFMKHPSKIHSLGLGDPKEKKDVIINNILHNKITYKGNIFPVKVEIKNQKYDNITATVILKKGGKSIQTKQVVLYKKKPISTVQFNVESKQEGAQKYDIEITPLIGEQSKENNYSSFTIDVLKGKDKILLIAYAPHPDIKALKSSIEKNEKKELEIKIITRGDKIEIKKDVGLVIFHNIPNVMNSGSSLIKQVKEKKKAIIYVAATGFNYRVLNKTSSDLTANIRPNQPDEVHVFLSPNFNSFQISTELKDRFNKYPPLKVPFGEWKLSPSIQPILSQKIHSIKTSKPILFVEKEKKQAFFIGEGLWRWRLSEYKEYENSNLFDEFIMKTIQFLNVQKDRRKFRVSTNKSSYTEEEKIIFTAEIYNDIYEPVYGNKIDIQIKNEKDVFTKFSFTTDKNNQGYKLESLPEGEYTYTASISNNGKNLKAKGKFVVRQINLESMQLQADHELLKNLSKTSGGKYLNNPDIEALISSISEEDLSGIVTYDSSKKNLIDLKWLFFLILGLASMEWGTRKYMGGY